MKNHTATHVLNWALREVLGDHVQQKGSLVDPEKTRFDFSHPKAMTPEEIERIERSSTTRSRPACRSTRRRSISSRPSRIAGLRAVFGENYPDRVRVSRPAPTSTRAGHPDNPQWRNSPSNSAAARTSATPATSSISSSPARKPSPRASAGSSASAAKKACAVDRHRPAVPRAGRVSIAVRAFSLTRMTRPTATDSWSTREPHFAGFIDVRAATELDGIFHPFRVLGDQQHLVDVRASETTRTASGYFRRTPPAAC